MELSFVPRARPLAKYGCSMAQTCAVDLEWSRRVVGCPSGVILNPLSMKKLIIALILSVLTFCKFANGQIASTTKFTNLSARVTVVPGKPPIIGFVIAGKPNEQKQVLIRAVGGSLAQFGVPNPVKTPKISIYKANGTPFSFIRLGIERTKAQWDAFFAQLGAFPIGTDEVAMVSYDAGSMEAGAYTIHISDVNNVGGEVLLEVYDANPTN